MIEKNKAIHIAKYAYNNIPFYENRCELLIENDSSRCCLEEKWNDIPVISKEDVVHYCDRLIAPSCLQYLLGGELTRFTTSGTTGAMLEIYWRKQECIASLLPLWMQRKKEHGILPEDKYCYFYTTHLIGREEPYNEKGKNSLGFCKINLNDDKLIKIYLDMIEFKPKWLLLQPSMSRLLCYVKKKYKLPSIDGLQYIEMTGEMLYDVIRKEAEEVFQCKIRNQYGCYEVNSIAYECSNGNMHIMEDNVYVEILDENNNQVEDGIEGDICVTSLINETMLFVRYKVGDRGEMIPTKCNCGRKERVLCLTQGRTVERIISLKNPCLSAYVFLKAVENVNALMEGAIIQFQIIQEELELFQVKLVVDDEISQEEIIHQFLKNIAQDELERAKYMFEFVDIILPDERNGKLGWFHSQVET